jgi:hypothetical protein
MSGLTWKYHSFWPRPMWLTELRGIELWCSAGKGSPAHRDLVERFVERLARDEADIVAKLVKVEFIREIPWVEMVFSSPPEMMRRVWKRQAQHNLARVPWPEFGQFSHPVNCLQISTVFRNDPDRFGILCGMHDDLLDKVYEEPMP